VHVVAQSGKLPVHSRLAYSEPVATAAPVVAAVSGNMTAAPEIAAEVRAAEMIVVAAGAEVVAGAEAVGTAADAAADIAPGVIADGSPLDWEAELQMTEFAVQRCCSRSLLPNRQVERLRAVSSVMRGRVRIEMMAGMDIDQTTDDCCAARRAVESRQD